MKKLKLSEKMKKENRLKRRAEMLAQMEKYSQTDYWEGICDVIFSPEIPAPKGLSTLDLTFEDLRRIQGYDKVNEDAKREVTEKPSLEKNEFNQTSGSNKKTLSLSGSDIEERININVKLKEREKRIRKMGESTKNIELRKK